MDKDRLDSVIKEVKKLSMGITCIQASGNYKDRKRIHLSDKELTEFMDNTKAQIFGAIASNLVLQEMFAVELKGRYNEFLKESDQLLAQMRKKVK